MHRVQDVAGVYCLGLQASLFLLIMALPTPFGVDILYSVPLVQLEMKGVQWWSRRPRSGQLSHRLPFATWFTQRVHMWPQQVQLDWNLELLHTLPGKYILSFPVYTNLGSQKSEDSAGRHVEPDSEATQMREELTSGDESRQNNTVWAPSLVSFKIFFLTYTNKISFYKDCVKFPTTCIQGLLSNSCRMRGWRREEMSRKLGYNWHQILARLASLGSSPTLLNTKAGFSKIQTLPMGQ